MDDITIRQPLTWRLESAAAAIVLVAVFVMRLMSKGTSEGLGGTVFLGLVACAFGAFALVVWLRIVWTTGHGRSLHTSTFGPSTTKTVELVPPTSIRVTSKMAQPRSGYRATASLGGMLRTGEKVGPAGRLLTVDMRNPDGTRMHPAAPATPFERVRPYLVAAYKADPSIAADDTSRALLEARWQGPVPEHEH